MTVLYERLLKPLLFRQDPEKVHARFVRLGKVAGRIPPARWLLRALYRYEHPALRQTVAGITFPNPIGLAAGFDKECELMRVLPSLGFGFAEVGSITAEPYEGNPGQRAVRVPEQEGLIINYGLKTTGAEHLRKKLAGKTYGLPVGVSVAKTNKKYENDQERLDDWMKGIELLQDCGEYLTINLSCPNLYDASTFTDPERLKQLLERMSTVRLGKPVFLKLGPDLTTKRADEIIRLCKPRKFVTGFIISNLIKDKKKVPFTNTAYRQQKGGMSGRPLKPHALALLTHFKKRGGSRFVLIGCGGVFTAQDAYDYLRAGASLVQLITGMIYKGPGTIKEINKGLVTLLERDGHRSVGEVTGTA